MAMPMITIASPWITWSSMMRETRIDVVRVTAIAPPAMTSSWSYLVLIAKSRTAMMSAPIDVLTLSCMTPKVNVPST